MASVASALIWLAADYSSGHPYSSPAIYFWNSAIRFGFFLIITLLTSALKTAHQHEKELARIDPLTGAANVRFFSELLQMEIDRSQRYGHAFTAVYMDVDNFKTVNDRYGHSMGNKVLTAIVKNAREHLRKTDIVARLGGDEFAFLLPETDLEGAQATISKVQISLLDEMSKNGWPVTFSMGVLTCTSMPPTRDDVMKQADELMYAVKNNGKNGISYSIYRSSQ